MVHPSVVWAQRKNCILLTVCLDDCKSPDIKFEPTQFLFKGIGGSNQSEYEASIELYGEVDPETSTFVARPRNIEVVLKKKEEGFWPRLTKGNGKIPWIKVDFNKWKDEDESEDEELGGLGGGMPGMGDMGGLGGMGGMGGMGGDTDFEEMMKSMGGMRGQGAGKPGFDMGDKTDSEDSEPEDADGEDTLPDLE